MREHVYRLAMYLITKFHLPTFHVAFAVAIKLHVNKSQEKLLQ
jgi:hypothetical protein